MFWYVGLYVVIREEWGKGVFSGGLMRGKWGREGLEKGWLSPNQTDTLNPLITYLFSKRFLEENTKNNPKSLHFSLEIQGKWCKFVGQVLETP